MSTRIETARWDHDRDGTFDQTRTTTFQFASDGKLATMSVVESYPGQTWSRSTAYEYDAAGRAVVERYTADTDGNGIPEDQGFMVRAHDGAGRVASEVTSSPDFDGDGVPGDYQTVRNVTYDAAGRVTANEFDYLYYGGQGDSDYRNEKWEYDAAGRLTKFYVDDPNVFDCEITDIYTYNKAGLLQNIRQFNEIRFGDDARARITESFTYNKDGTMKTKTDWATQDGWQRVDTAFTWKAGYDSQKITYDREGDFKAEAIDLVENWYNSAGQLTHTLVSHDTGANGGPLPGGFDTRDLFVKQWAGDVMVAETHDLGADGVPEYQFTELLVA